ncbi:hypothetical protein OIU85_015550 [Salix viminalis]|uniref:Uncharacterized protein n=1 Tax=Salix viminalis TaxID=40686 RepID=A0A9Q0NLB4_SALVM|nr:hypothetical protein OIU85_015550 [Salix viminalis]
MYVEELSLNLQVRDANITGRLKRLKGSILKGKHIKKHLALDENRRNTYKQFHPSAGGRVPSVLNTFDAERKQLVAMIKLTMVVTHAPCPCAWFGVASQTTQPGFKPHNGGLGICASRE